MPVFISYSRVDNSFATRLAMQLVKHRANVWIDQWELHVGDSLISKIQDAIQGASALIVILSKASVESEWCKKELNSGLIRELDEKRVVILPVLMEECTIPLFLREKLYADFRTDFDAGLRSVLEAIARVTSDTLIRTESPEWHVDWAFDWALTGRNDFSLTLTAVEQAVGQPFTVLTVIQVKANAVAADRYVAMLEAGFDWVERAILLEFIGAAINEKALRIRLEDEKAQKFSVRLVDKSSPAVFDLEIVSRRLGSDTGRDIVLDIGSQVNVFRAHQQEVQKRLSPREQERVRGIRALFASKGPNPRDYVAC